MHVQVSDPTACALQKTLVLLVLVEGHVLTDLRDGVLRVLSGEVHWVDAIKDLSISEAFDRDGGFESDLAAAIVLEGRWVVADLLHLEEDEGDSEALVLERDVLVLAQKLLADFLLDSHVALD